jgi:hypothetical protein
MLPFGQDGSRKRHNGPSLSGLSEGAQLCQRQYKRPGEGRNMAVQDELFPQFTRPMVLLHV